jgi:hypothetical protein
MPISHAKREESRAGDVEDGKSPRSLNNRKLQGPVLRLLTDEGIPELRDRIPAQGSTLIRFKAACSAR